MERERSVEGERIKGEGKRGRERGEGEEEEEEEERFLFISQLDEGTGALSVTEPLSL